MDGGEDWDSPSFGGPRLVKRELTLSGITESKLAYLNLIKTRSLRCLSSNILSEYMETVDRVLSHTLSLSFSVSLRCVQDAGRRSVRESD